MDFNEFCNKIKLNGKLEIYIQNNTDNEEGPFYSTDIRIEKTHLPTGEQTNSLMAKTSNEFMLLGTNIIPATIFIQENFVDNIENNNNEFIVSVKLKNNQKIKYRLIMK